MRGSKQLPLTRYYVLSAAPLLVALGLAVLAAPIAQAGDSSQRDFGGVRRLGGPQGGASGWITEVRPRAAGGLVTDRKRQPPATAEEALELVQSEFREATGDRVFFAAGSAELGARSKRALIEQAHYLVERPELIIVIDGHADDAGSSQKMMGLSTARANVVANMLVDAGVARERVSIRSAGNTERVADCDAPACAAQNRRAVTRVVAVAAPQALSKSDPQPPRSFGPRFGLGVGGAPLQRER